MDGDDSSVLAQVRGEEGKLAEKKCSIWVVVAYLRVNLGMVE
jgi:hypothetical protein